MRVYAEHGITGAPGGLAEFIAIPAVNAISVNSELDPVRAALTEPLVVHSMNASPERRVRAAMILGAGQAGLLSLSISGACSVSMDCCS
jgi:threonine dehydrogenase-like Zn-dependent dehydrogenase